MTLEPDLLFHHTPTDPRCVLFEEPRTRRQRAKFNQARGIHCHACQGLTTERRTDLEKIWKKR